MNKLKKNLKKIFVKKQIFLNTIETTIIQRSVYKNLRKKNCSRVIVLKTRKKKTISRWGNCCFFLGLHRIQLKQFTMSRFALKTNSSSLRLTGLQIISW